MIQIAGTGSCSRMQRIGSGNMIQATRTMNYDHRTKQQKLGIRTQAKRTKNYDHRTKQQELGIMTQATRTRNYDHRKKGTIIQRTEAGNYDLNNKNQDHESQSQKKEL